MSDLETVPNVASAATRRVDNGELLFTLERALEVIGACTSAEIAVLGIEVLPGLNVSTYDQRMKDPADEAHWPGYVRTNNALAEDFVKENCAPGKRECILTTASWREFLELQQFRRKGLKE